jgi:beta-1,4-mannosyl-glycoprotein beta-1,4-N-acetylglucosaminyltransferase
MKVYDSFLLNDEIELMLVRLAEHDSFVDQFIVVQADRTHSGLPKEICIGSGDPRVRDYEHKIIWINVTLEACATANDRDLAARNENKQRDAFIQAVNYDSEDIILLSDLDEIVDQKTWPKILECMRQTNIVSLRQSFYYYALNLQAKVPWLAGKFIRAKLIQQCGFGSRDLRSNIPTLATEFNCGWHFSYLMEPSKIAEKIQSFQHTEFNNLQFKNLANIQSALRWRRDLYHRPIFFRRAGLNRLPQKMMQSSYWRRFMDDRKNPLITVVAALFFVKAWIRSSISNRREIFGAAKRYLTGGFYDATLNYINFLAFVRVSSFRFSWSRVRDEFSLLDSLLVLNGGSVTWSNVLKIFRSVSERASRQRLIATSKCNPLELVIVSRAAAWFNANLLILREESESHHNVPVKALTMADPLLTWNVEQLLLVFGSRNYQFCSLAELKSHANQDYQLELYSPSGEFINFDKFTVIKPIMRLARQ